MSKKDGTGYEVTIRPVAFTPGPDMGNVKVNPNAGVGRMFVATEARAKELVNGAPSHRSYRPVPWEQIPEEARLRLEAAEAS